MKFAQIVIGPAGSGKSTYCYNVQEHCKAKGRIVHIFNLDPAAEFYQYEAASDVKDLITVDDVMEELDLGPNGGLMYCMEYLEENLHEWLADELEGYNEDDYLVFDCPGQIELYTHIPVVRTIIDYLRREGWSLCAVYCLDSHFVTDSAKMVSGCFQALSAMMALEVAHVNILTKVDLLHDKERLEDMLQPDKEELIATLSSSTGPKFRQLNKVVADVVDTYGMISLMPLDISDEESIEDVLMHIDHALQYGDDLDVKIPNDDEDAAND